MILAKPGNRLCGIPGGAGYQSHSTTVSYCLDTKPRTPYRLVQGCISLMVTIMIFVRVFDLHGCLRSVRERRTEYRQKKEDREMQKIERLFTQMQRTPIHRVDFNSEEEADSEDVEKPRSSGRTRKKSRRAVVSPRGAGAAAGEEVEIKL